MRWMYLAWSERINVTFLSLWTIFCRLPYKDKPVMLPFKVPANFIQHMAAMSQNTWAGNYWTIWCLCTVSHWFFLFSRKLHALTCTNSGCMQLNYGASPSVAKYYQCIRHSCCMWPGPCPLH